jgi:hypothetical protein
MVSLYFSRQDCNPKLGVKILIIDGIIIQDILRTNFPGNKNPSKNLILLGRFDPVRFRNGGRFPAIKKIIHFNCHYPEQDRIPYSFANNVV